MGVETWIEEQENAIIFDESGNSGGAEASRLLEISPTNRIIVNSDQAKLLMVLRMAAMRFRKWYFDTDKYKYIDDVANMIEEHQLTLEGESRFQFSRVAIAQYIARLITRGKRELESLVRGTNQ